MPEQSNTKYRLICMSFDGDYVNGSRDTFESIADAWEESNDMGSRWYFYPFHFVVTESGQTVVAAPELLTRFERKRVATVRREFEQLSKQPEMQNADTEEFALTLHFSN
jgi:hypothetical protein